MTRIRNNGIILRSSFLLIFLLSSIFNNNNNNNNVLAVDNNNEYHGYETVIINCHGPHHTTMLNDEDDDETIAIMEDTFLATYNSLISRSLPVEFIDAEILTDNNNNDNDPNSYSFTLRLYYICHIEDGCNDDAILPLFSHPSLVEEEDDIKQLPTATFFTNVYRNELSLKLLSLDDSDNDSVNEQSLLFHDIVSIVQESEIQPAQETVEKEEGTSEEKKVKEESKDEYVDTETTTTTIHYDLSKRTPFMTKLSYGIVMTMHKDIILMEKDDEDGFQKMILMLLERVFVDAYNTMMIPNTCYDAPYFRKLYTTTASVILPSEDSNDEENVYILFTNFAGSCLGCKNNKNDDQTIRLFNNDDDGGGVVSTLVEGTTNTNGDDIISCATIPISDSTAGRPTREEFHKVFHETMSKVIPGHNNADDNVVIVEENNDDNVYEIQSYPCNYNPKIVEETSSSEELYHQLIRIDMMGIPNDLILINENEMLRNYYNHKNNQHQNKNDPSSSSTSSTTTIMDEYNKEEDKDKKQEFMDQAILTRLNEFELEQAFIEVYNNEQQQEEPSTTAVPLQEQLSSSCPVATKKTGKIVTGARFVAIIGMDGSQKNIYDSIMDHGNINLYDHDESSNNNLRGRRHRRHLDDENRKRKLQRGYEIPNNYNIPSIPYSVILNITYTCNDDCTSPLFTTDHTKFLQDKRQEGINEMNHHRRNLRRHMNHRFMAEEETMCYCNLNNDNDDDTISIPSAISSDDFKVRYYQNLISKYDLHGIHSITNVVAMMDGDVNDDDEAEGDPSEDEESLEQEEDSSEEEASIVAATHVDEAIQGAVQYEEEEEAAIDESIQDALQYEQKKKEEDLEQQQNIVALNIGAAIQDALLFEKQEDDAMQNVLTFEHNEEAKTIITNYEKETQTIAIDEAIHNALNFQKELEHDVVIEVGTYSSVVEKEEKVKEKDDEDESSSICQDDDTVFFYVNLGNKYGPKQKVNCYWLRHHIERLEELCTEDTIYNTCAYTCAKCITDEEEPVDYFEDSEDSDDEDEYSYEDVMATRSSGSLENHMELFDEKEDIHTMQQMMNYEEENNHDPPPPNSSSPKIVPQQEQQPQQQKQQMEQDPITSTMETIYHHHLTSKKKCRVPNVNSNKVRFPIIRNSDCTTTLELINDSNLIPDCCTNYGTDGHFRRTVVLNDGHNCIEDDEGTDQELINRWSQSYIDGKEDKNKEGQEDEKIPVLEGLCLSRGYYKVK